MFRALTMRSPAVVPSFHSSLAKAKNQSNILIARTPILKSGMFNYSVNLLSVLMHSHSARLVKWITENNRPVNIVNNHELHDLLTAGRPHITIPSASTITRDIQTSFEKCRERISTLLQVSHLKFNPKSTDIVLGASGATPLCY